MTQPYNALYGHPQAPQDNALMRDPQSMTLNDMLRAAESMTMRPLAKGERPADPLRWAADYYVGQNKDLPAPQFFMDPRALSARNMLHSALNTSANWLDGTRDPSRIGPEEMVAPLGLAGMGMAMAPKNSVGMFGGRLAKTADQNALATAEKMAATGAPREDVWKQTGWFQGVDGKWRYEIDDSKSAIGPKAQEELTAGGDHGATQRLAAGFLHHKDMFGAYPELRHASVDARYNSALSPGFRIGSYDHVNQSTGRPQIAITTNALDSNWGPRSVGLHEFQHGIQRREGFEPGSDITQIPSGEYKRNAGEVEARTVQKRMDMSADERRARPPWMDYDVPEKDQIVRSVMADNAKGSAPGTVVNSLAEQPIPSPSGSRNAMMFDPPNKPERPFEADYPQGALTDAARTRTSGQVLAWDMDGRPLTAGTVAGRRVVDGSDQPVTASQIDPLTEALIGSRPQEVPARELGRDVGRLTRTKDAATGFDQYDIRVAQDLAPRSRDRVVAHEFGHGVDEIAGKIPTDGLSRELAQLYNTLNTGREQPRNLMGPQHTGYSGGAVPRELMAEAIRAYMADPNYLKTVAPKTAARIREHVNGNPALSRVIQFNADNAKGSAPGTVVNSMAAQNYEAMTLPQLKALAKERGLVNTIDSTKAGWVETLRSGRGNALDESIYSSPFASAPGLAANSTQQDDQGVMSILRRYGLAD